MTFLNLNKNFKVKSLCKKLYDNDNDNDNDNDIDNDNESISLSFSLSLATSLNYFNRCHQFYCVVKLYGAFVW